jgi:hypothetical protein
LGNGQIHNNCSMSMPCACYKISLTFWRMQVPFGRSICYQSLNSISRPILYAKQKWSTQFCSQLLSPRSPENVAQLASWELPRIKKLSNKQRSLNLKLYTLPFEHSLLIKFNLVRNLRTLPRVHKNQRKLYVVSWIKYLPWGSAHA